MKQPNHRPGPEFEKAADAAEKERQQRIASLSDPQRQEYEALERSHSAAEKNKSHTLKRKQERELADRMRAKLAPQPQPRFKIGGLAHAPDKQQLKRMRHSVDDYLADRQTPDTNSFALQLQQAETKTRDEFANHSKEAIKTMREDHHKQRDKFLDKCEKDRAREQNKAALKENAQDITWNRALEKAASQEKGREKERSLSQEFSKLR